MKTEKQKQNIREASLRWFNKNKERGHALSKAWRQGLRRKVLEHYSNGEPVCACCGETLYEFLTIDHLNNNGTADRRRYTGGGHHHYRQIIKEGFPKGFQVLCYNCNCGRAKTPTKECPHVLYEKGTFKTKK